MRPDDVHAGPCPPPADVTAYAHGELLEWRRAEIARHILRCAACRDLHARATDVFVRLRALGDEGDLWRDDVALARRLAAARRRRTAVAAAVVTTGAAGLLFCWLRERSGSLVAPAMLHVATNSLGTLASAIVHRLEG